MSVSLSLQASMVSAYIAGEIVISDFFMCLSIFVWAKRPYCALIRTGKLNQEEKLEAEAEKAALARNVSLIIVAGTRLIPIMKSATALGRRKSVIKKERSRFKGHKRVPKREKFGESSD